MGARIVQITNLSQTSTGPASGSLPVRADAGLDRLMGSPGPLDTARSSYTVHAGDTLSAIADRHGTSWRDLARANGIADPNMIHPGQVLRLPAAASATHTVQPGDTLGAIARRSGSTVEALARANGIGNADLIHPGQVLTIPRATATPQAAAPAAPATPAPAPQPASDHRLGSLSAEYESGGRGAATVSSGRNDPGGVSYGTYQLSTNAGTLQSFLRNEGAGWAGELGDARPGTASFSDRWRQIAAREPQAFGDAQHAFIERTHYSPAVAAVQDRTGVDLDSRHNAVRDAVWSVSVQHGGAATILNRAVAQVSQSHAPADAGYDRALIGAIYDQRTRYVLDVAQNNTGLSAGERQQLRDITTNRYPAERRDALAMLDAAPAQPVARPPAEAPVEAPATGPLDGRAQAARHGVQVKNGSVAIGALDAAMNPVIPAVAEAAQRLGLPTPVITSGNDSRHGSASLHYQDRALDFRGNNISDAQGRALAAEVSRILGGEFDVLFETFVTNPANDHLHIEYDPR